MENIVEIVLSFGWVGFIVVADTDVDRQSARYSPVVLGKYADIGLPPVTHARLIRPDKPVAGN